MMELKDPGKLNHACDIVGNSGSRIKNIYDYRSISLNLTKWG
jgi:hypothetical protein